MTQAELKKRRERIIAEAFLARLKANWTLENRENPDFLLTAQHKRVGLELTQLFSDEGSDGSLLRRGEALRERFLRNLAAAYYAQGGLPLDVQARLPEGDISTDAVSDLAAQLREWRPAEPWAERERTFLLGRHCTAKFYLQSLPDEAGQYRAWQSLGDTGGLVESLNPEVLTRCVAAKAIRLPTYRSVSESVILLVYVDRTRSSGKLVYGLWEPPRPIPSHSFSEVYLFIYPLKVIRVA